MVEEQARHLYNVNWLNKMFKSPTPSFFLKIPGEA